jgi:hypothetical protein
VWFAREFGGIGDTMRAASFKAFSREEEMMVKGTLVSPNGPQNSQDPVGSDCPSGEIQQRE